MKALVIYLISNLMKLTIKIRLRISFGLAWQFNYQKSGLSATLIPADTLNPKGSGTKKIRPDKICQGVN